MKTPPTNLSSLEFVHVTRKGNNSIFQCAFGSNCGRTTVKVAKKTTKASLCVHEHLVKMVVDKVNNSENLTNVPSAKDQKAKGSEEIESEDDMDHYDWLDNTAKFVYENHKMDLSFANLREIESQILKIHKSDEGFPEVFQVCNKNPRYNSITFISAIINNLSSV